MSSGLMITRAAVRKWTIVISLLVFTTPAHAQSAAPETLRPDQSPLGAIWRAILRDYAKGRYETEADILARRGGDLGYMGKWQKGGTPRVLLLRVLDTTFVIDRPWGLQAATDSLISGYCEREAASCPGGYVTLFLQLGLPSPTGPGSVKVAVTELTLSPEYCRETPQAFTLSLLKVFELRQKDSVWVVRNREKRGIGVGQCH
jgi:hypothetical protein